MWMGQSDASAEVFEDAGIPSYATETAAVSGFTHLVRYQDARKLLMAAPPSLPQDFAPDPAAVRPIIDDVLADKRTWLDPIELSRVLFRLRHCGHAGRSGA